jgi:hypothetical protein
MIHSRTRDRFGMDCGGEPGRDTIKHFRRVEDPGYEWNDLSFWRRVKALIPMHAARVSRGFAGETYQ